GAETESSPADRAACAVADDDLVPRFSSRESLPVAAVRSAGPRFNDSRSSGNERPAPLRVDAFFWPTAFAAARANRAARSRPRSQEQGFFASRSKPTRSPSFGHFWQSSSVVFARVRASEVLRGGTSAGAGGGGRGSEVGGRTDVTRDVARDVTCDV